MGPLCCELDGGVGMIQIFQEPLQGCFAMAPYGKDIINILPPYEGLGAGVDQELIFQRCHQQIGIGGGHLCAHCCAMDL